MTKEWWVCHEEYAFERLNILSTNDKEWLSVLELEEECCGGDNDRTTTKRKKRKSMREMIQLSGVAGTDHKGLRENSGGVVPSPDSSGSDGFVPSLKCLHSHYAHYRSQLLLRKDDADAMLE